MRAAVAIAAALAVIGTACSGCSAPSADSGSAPSWAGRAYPQRVGEPTLRFSATDGSVLNLPARSRGGAAVVVFAALGDPVAQRFLIDLARAARALDAEAQRSLLVVVVSTDPAHDSLDALRAKVAQLGPHFLGARATFPMVESVARAVGLDVSPPSGGRYLAIGPQAVGFDASQVAVVAWPLDTDPAGLARDLRQLT